MIDKITKNKRNTLIFILFLTLIASLPIFIMPGIKKGDDTYFHLSRICALSDNIKNFNFFSGVYPGYFNDYGYANGLFYPDIFLYFPALLKVLGLSVINAYKIFLVVINFLSIGSIFVSIKGISKNKYASVIGSIIYAFASYRLVDMFERGALGETLAFIFAPLIVYGIYEIIYRDYKKFYLLVIGMSGLILSHIVSTYMVGIFLFLFCLLNIKRLFSEKRRLLYLFLSAFLTLLITSYFLLPMVEQMMSNTFYYNSTGSKQEFVLSNRTVPIYLLFLEVPNLRKAIFNKYWVPSGIGIIFLYLIYIWVKNRKMHDKFIKDSFILGIVFLLMTTFLFPWDLGIIKSVLYMIQFPWRFYFLSTLLFTIGGSILVSRVNESKKLLRNVLIISFISIISMFVICIVPKRILNVVEYDASYAEYLPSVVDRNFIKNRGVVITSNNKVKHDFKKNGTSMNITFENKSDDTYLELPLVYYKGYTAKIDNNVLDVFMTSNGLVGVYLNDIDKGNIVVSYSGTLLCNITKYVSLVSSILFILYVRKVKYEK